jgi:NADPH2:quinone reductase
MRALRLIELSGPDGLELADVPEPDAGEGMVLIDVHAAGVAFPDLLLTRGEYQIKADPPFVPGIEVAGVVREAPEGSVLAPGMRVAAQTALGGFAEVAAAPVGLTFAIPDAMTFEQASGFVMNYHTAWFGLARRGRLAAGEALLVHGAAGGVGSAAVQVGKGLGARVIAAVSDEAKEAVARDAGADAVVRVDGDWVGAVRELTDGRGADVVFDPVGGDRFELSPRCLAPEGRLLVIGFAEGRIPEIAANRVLLRNIDVVGVNWGGFLGAHPGLASEGAAALAELFERGFVRPLVGGTYPLEEGARALRDLDERRATGKLVLSVRA